MKRFELALLFITLLIGTFIIFGRDSYAVGYCGECVAPTPYSCGGGDMCCHNNGCPSYVCYDANDWCQDRGYRSGSWTWTSAGGGYSFVRCYPTGGGSVNFRTRTCNERCDSCTEPPGGGGGGGGTPSVNNPPVATISTTSPLNTSAPGPLAISPNSTWTFNTVATDPDDNLHSIQLNRRAYDPNNPSAIIDPAVDIGTVTCSGGTCTSSLTWTPSISDLNNGYDGWWIIYPNVYDDELTTTADSQCTGRQLTPPDYSDCDPVNAEESDTDNIKVHVCGLAPDVPALSSPSNGAPQVDTPVTFSWQALVASGFGDACGTQNNTYTLEYRRSSDTLWTTGCSNTTNTSCSNIDLEKNTTYRWRVYASNGEYTTYSAEWSFTTVFADPGWFTTINGDVYAGGNSGIEMTTPLVVTPPFAPAYLARLSTGRAGAVFAAGSLGDILVDRAGVVVNSLISQDNIWVKRMPVSNMWPVAFSTDSGTPMFEMPGAADNSPLTNLNPMQVRVISNPALLTSGLTYNLTSPGVAVVYLSGAGAVTLNGNINSSAGDERMILITNRDIIVGTSLGSAVTDPLTELTRPQIEMAIITAGNITYPGISSPQGTDLSLVVEGPVISGSQVSLLRSRDNIENAFPAEIVNYNLDYLRKITMQERSSMVPNYTGLITNEIIWEGN